MKSSPAFQFYADDFIAGTIKFTDAELGLYMRLLCAQWSEGSLPNDDAELLTYGKGETPLARVKSKFKKCQDGRLRNERLENVRAEQERFRQSRSESGKNGASKRWLSHSSAIAEPLANAWQSDGKRIANTMANDSSPTPTPLSTHTQYAEHPGLPEILAYAATIGLGEWKATDWFNEMESCGWLDYRHRPVTLWRPALTRVKAKWESDGRPTQPPSNAANKPNNRGGIDRSKGTFNEGRANDYE